MARLSISIPDELMARLEPVKAEINVSQLCREALERRIASFERATNGKSEELDLESLVSRLRDEQEIAEGKFEELGRKNALTWLSNSPFIELRSVAEAPAPGNMCKYRLPYAAFRVMKHDMDESATSCEGPQAVVYKTAWVDYVKTVWADVVKRLAPPNHEEALETATSDTAT